VSDEQTPREPEPTAPEPDQEGTGAGRSLFRDLTGVGVDWRSAVLVPVLAVFTAIVIGALIIAITDIDALRIWGSQPGEAFRETGTTIKDAYLALFQGAFGSVRAWSETLVSSAPLILAGLAVAIGFRAGLFNIGAEGQMIIGGLLAVIVGFYFTDLPAVIHLPMALLAAAVGGAVWGGIPGLLRAKTGAHEVITTIMMNWVAVFFLTWVLKVDFIQTVGRDDPISKDIRSTAVLPRGADWMERLLAVAIIVVVLVVAAYVIKRVLRRQNLAGETLLRTGRYLNYAVAAVGFGALVWLLWVETAPSFVGGILPGSFDDPNLRVHAGIVVALAAAAFSYWLLYRSTIGYEFRAVGYNPDGAHYAGMSVTWLYVMVMAVAGAMAGLAGGNQILGVLDRATPGFSAGIGFDAISLALLGRSHPAGVVLAGILFGALDAGGREMQVATDVSIDLILVLQALIVVFIAAPALIRAIYRVRTGKGAEQLTRGWAS